MLFPLFSILRQERRFARPPTQFVMLHLKRSHMMEWVRATLATALGVGPKRDLPPIMWQQEQDHITKQLGECGGVGWGGVMWQQAEQGRAAGRAGQLAGQSRGRALLGWAAGMGQAG